MGKEKQSTQTQQSTSQQTQATPTPLEQRSLERAEEREIASQEGLIGAQTQGLNLINQLLTGGQLPGFLGGLPGGISPEAIGSQATRLAGQNLANFNQLGIADSGPAFRETAADIANRVLFPAEQFNLQNISQLLNLAVGGQAGIQQNFNQGASVLGGQLAGLRSISQAGTNIGEGRAQTNTNFFASPFGAALAGGFFPGLGTALRPA